jgi:hypothetical protein
MIKADMSLNMHKIVVVVNSEQGVVKPIYLLLIIMTILIHGKFGAQTL